MEIPVLIVGGGPTGLASSILLSRLGVRSLLVGRHHTTSIFPKATEISTRSMELFWKWGLENRIRAFAHDHAPVKSAGLTHASPELARPTLDYPAAEELAGLSPTGPAICPPDFLEPVLLDYARGFTTATVRIDEEFVALIQDEWGVEVVLRTRSTGKLSLIRARFVIAADGASSPIRQQLGISMIMSASTSAGAVQVAERFNDGHVFLAGDAAHRMSFAGGLGMNTGIEDAHNLTWKLAAVLRGWAGTELLQSYEPERKRVAEREVARRAPHFWLQRSGRRMSSLGMFEDRMVMFVGPDGARWRELTGQVADSLGVPIETILLDEATVGPDPRAQWRSRFEVNANGAVLVRPDGHIAWCSPASNQAGVSVLSAAIKRILAKGGMSWREQPEHELDEAVVLRRRSA